MTETFTTPARLAVCRVPPKPFEDLKQLLAAILATRASGDFIRRTFTVELAADTIDHGARSVRVIASTDSLDSYDEVVEQKWDLSRYKKNPVVLYGHNRVGFLGMGGDPNHTLPIGHASKVQKVDGHLEATLTFVDGEANPMAERVWQGLVQGSLRAVSVGFRPHSVRTQVDDDVETLILSDNELYEISVVPIPANADAVALSSDERRHERAALLARASGVTKQPRRDAPPQDAPSAQEKTLMDEATKAALEAANKELIDTKAALQVAEKALADEKAAHEKTSAEAVSLKGKVKGLELKSGEQAKAIESLSAELKTRQSAERKRRFLVHAGGDRVELRAARS